MDLDEDAPPDLVEVAAAADEEEMKEVPFKVPITIVTGMLPLVMRAAVAQRRLTVLEATWGLARRLC